MTASRRPLQEAATSARVVVALLAAILSAGALAAVYWVGGQVQLEGLFLAATLGSLAAAAVIWGHHLMPQTPVIEDREELASSEEERRQVAAQLGPEEIRRRRLLRWLLGGAVGSAAAATLFPIGSLGPLPQGALSRTPWRRGSRAVDEEGRPIRAEDVEEGGFLTVFPDGHHGSADGQTLLLRVDPGLLSGSVSAMAAQGGLLAYSKVCTHLGCAVTLYQADEHVLLCPCHQSTFDVIDGARVTFGPAVRSLPQLPIRVDDRGFVVAQGDFDDAIGPGFWYRPE